MATTDGMNVKQVLDAADIAVGDKLSYLKKKTINVPEWRKLEKEYYQKKHPVKTDPSYVDNGKEKLSRITLGWQKLATKRMSALLCGIPVKRVYHTDNDAQKQASQIIEDIYTRNRIDSVNLERAKKLYAACEIVTIWFAYEAYTTYAGAESKLKLRCRTYSPMKGDKLYPLFDEYDDLVALSIEYTRNEDNKNVTYFDTYTDDTHILYNVTEQTEVFREEINIGKIPGVYIHRDEPVWEDESDNVYEAEWMLSRNGNYIRKSSRPQLAIFSDAQKVEVNKSKSNGKTDNNVSRDIIRLGKEDKMEYITWQGSNDAIKFQTEALKHNFNSQLQLPDMSMDNMKSSPMSGESRKMLFIDSQMKVTDECGIWLEGYDREFNVIRSFAKQMFPSLAEAIEALRVDHIVTPYQIRDEKESVETLSTAAGTIASRKTCVERLGWVEDVDKEVELINGEQTEDIFNAVQ